MRPWNEERLCKGNWRPELEETTDEWLARLLDAKELARLRELEAAIRAVATSPQEGIWYLDRFHRGLNAYLAERERAEQADG